eukprot:TRINITY_DN1575_c0_g1_i1.p1 TRINITY_DN1575_c0_g1~~TRINITY_DN1575_c0_g1_i1.p1  ORF type:complete len:199 (-),score=35.44 TRINITY_DN1575_c0_g1_i1:329-841(-)
MLLLPLLYLFASLGLAVPVVEPVVEENEADWECLTCTNVMDQVLGDLINIIANGGVVGGCSDLCSYLNESLAQEGCNILCDIVGIEEFTQLLQSADPDPIWICVELSLCPYNDNAAGKVDTVTATPSTATQGSNISLSCTFQVSVVFLYLTRLDYQHHWSWTVYVSYCSS